MNIINANDFFKSITKENIVAAIKYIDDNDLELKPSTTYDLLFDDGKRYPPKEILRVAAKLNELEISEKTLYGGEANKPFERLGFTIVQKKETSELDGKLSEYWIKYKDYFNKPTEEHQEKYKWNVLKQVYDKWNWNAENKTEMFKKAFEVEGKKNLWISGNFFPIGHTYWMLIKFKDETINEFNNLFNEELPLLDRVNSFKNFYDIKLPELQKSAPDKTVNYHSHNDLRAIALYLTLQYPEKYFLYKFTMFKNFNLKVELPKIKTGDNNNLETFIKLSNEVLQFIKKDVFFIQQYRDFTSKIENYNDESLHLLTQDFIYTIANYFNEGNSYWRIGSNDGTNSYYNNMLDENYIAIGWNEIGDLEQQEIDNKSSIKELLNDEGFKFKTENVLTRKSGEIFNFYSTASVNDIVTLMDGNSVLAIGKITSDYNYDESKPFSHYREIEWLKKDITKFEISDGLQTSFYQLSKKETIKRIESELKYIPTSINTSMNTSNKKIPLNQILYGAPGTGKTYKTKELAVEIITGKKIKDREELTKVYDELKEKNQINFTTFHQSISYEDFVEGIKPKLNDENYHEISYEIKDGIFKQICRLDNENIFSKLFYEGKRFANWEVKKITSDTVYFGKPNGGILMMPLPLFLDLYHLIDKRGIDFSSGNLHKDIEFDRAEYPFIERFYINGYENLHKHIYHEYLNLMRSTDFEVKKRVLIIDEINRGNVSAIFGELITLIEEDKRLGKKEALEVTLPYSKTTFGVPENLYILGTMNTADRSVESLDTALRRRFSFIEMQPDLEVLKTEHLTNGLISHDAIELDMVDMLEKINKRIEILLNKDHKIGHSFFINVSSFEELQLVFKDKIIPLLEEYFFGDFGKIGLVLGESFIKNNNIGKKDIFAKFDDYEDRSLLADKFVYETNNPINLRVEHFKAIYE